MSTRLRIGTRGSALALAQAGWVRAALLEQWPDLDAQLVPITTSGDRFADQPLGRIGGKGLFVKEIEEAVLDGQVDCAVHSLKDLPAAVAPGLILAAYPRRADPRDVVITRQGLPLAQLPAGARVGTSSLRRTALLRADRPDLALLPLRGNVDTRLRKLEGGEIEAVVLAAAGLARLGIQPGSIEILDPRRFVPAIGQGALAVECRQDAVQGLLQVLDHDDTRVAVTAERAFMAAAGGSCHTPLGAHAVVLGSRLDLDAFIASPDGGRVVRGNAGGRTTEAADVGRRLAEELLGRGGADILAALETEPIEVPGRSSGAKDGRR